MKLIDESSHYPGRRPAASPQPSARLKICFIVEPLHAGVGRHVVDIASGLADRGHAIHVLYSPVRLEPRFLSTLTQHPRIRCHAIKMMPGLCASDIAAFWQVKDYVTKNGPFDIIHGESSKGGGFARLLKPFGAKMILHSPHAFVTLSPRLSAVKHWAFRTIERLLARWTDTLVCSSQNEYEHAIALGIPARKLAVVVNGRPSGQAGDRLSVREELGLAADTVVIGFAGRLETQKAPRRLIEACVRLLPQMPQMHLLAIGDGPLRDELQARIARAGLKDRVTWLGAVNAVQYMPAMDMFAMPSLYEGFAYVLLEALQAGLPIVATPVGGTAESVLPGINGFIVPHAPVEPLVSALRQLGLDADLRQRMALASAQHANHFSTERMIDGMENLYRQAMDNDRRPQTVRPAAQNEQLLIWKRARAYRQD